MALAALILGIVAMMLWAFTVGAGAYVWYRYVRVPWTVMRKDMRALAEEFAKYDTRLDALDEFTRSARIQHLTDEEQLKRERLGKMKRAGIIIGS